MANEIAPLVQRWIEGHIAAAPSGHVPLLFISGAQGSGKSTALAEALGRIQRRIVGASLDDFYATLEQRRARGAGNPLFEVRGPPGTHKLALLNLMINVLRSTGSGTEFDIPIFNKAADRPLPHSMWRTVRGRPAAIVIEGWMMGVLPVTCSDSSDHGYFG